jgi:hypothetical protein
LWGSIRRCYSASGHEGDIVVPVVKSASMMTIRCLCRETIVVLNSTEGRQSDEANGALDSERTVPGVTISVGCRRGSRAGAAGKV